jgi:hypothetical protein
MRNMAKKESLFIVFRRFSEHNGYDYNAYIYKLFCHKFHFWRPIFILNSGFAVRAFALIWNKYKLLPREFSKISEFLYRWLCRLLSKRGRSLRLLLHAYVIYCSLNFSCIWWRLWVWWNWFIYVGFYYTFNIHWIHMRQIQPTTSSFGLFGFSSSSWAILFCLILLSRLWTIATLYSWARKTHRI